MYLVSKLIRHKLYIFIFPPSFNTLVEKLVHGFVIRLSISTNWKSETDDSIRIIVDQHIKMVYYKPVRVIIDAPSLAEVIIELVVQHYGFPDSIVSDWDLFFSLKFCYFYIISMESSKDSQPLFICKLIVRIKDKTVLCRSIFELLSIWIKIIRQGSNL